MRVRWSLGFLLAVLCGSLSVFGVDDLSVSPAADGFARAPYLQLASPNLMHVVWRSWGPITPVVRYGTDLNSLSETVPAHAIVTRASLGKDDDSIPASWVALRTPQNLKLPKLHSAPIGVFQYEARLANLRPSTRYYYGVFDGSRRLTPADSSYSFATPPPPGTRRPIRFSVIGDSGTGRLPQYQVREAMLEQARRTGQPLDFWIHVGDMAYGDGRDMEFQSRMFEPYQAFMRNTVCWPTMGNHEGHTSRGSTGVGPYYDGYVLPTRGEAGGLASGTEAYYSFDHGNIHFICLDSHDLERKPGAAMARWLKADLERANADWIVAFWHHPPYTKGSHDSDRERDLTEMRQYIMPIIESGGVDLVLTGHSHTYERSMLMDGAYATPTVSENVILDDGDGDPESDGAYRKSSGIHPHGGTIQVVAGHGGTTLGRNGSMPVMKKILVEHGSVIIDVNGDTLLAQMISRQGSVRDLFSIVKRGTVENTRLALPWQPAAYTKPANPPRVPAAPAVDHQILIPKNAEWRYLASAHPQGSSWTRPEFDAGGWSTGRAPFGFGDGEFMTRLSASPRQAPALYLRKEFQIAQGDAVTELGLSINYSHGLIVYVNGREVARSNIGRSSGRNVQSVKARTEEGTLFLPLRGAHRDLRHGTNILAIEAHGVEDALDFALDPVLLLED